jgi:N-acyl-D-aspartate/D-glutamate deacylase
MAETIVRNGLFFDGRGTAPDRKDLRIADGVLLEVSDAPLEARAGERVIDAEGCWVVPGFIDIHTHYDAELEMNPALDESLRHGVTTVFIGSCSLSAAVGEPDDIADMFTRVEAIPDGFLRPLLRARKDWRTHAEYAAHLDALPLGPNVSSFVGYSAVRAHVLGLSRSLDPRVRPTRDELDRMEASLEEAYDAGFLGLSLNSLHWDKMGGDRFRGEHLPSTNASWRELRRMVRGARRRGLNLQALPNVAQRYDLLFYAAFSMGFGLRNALKTSIVSIMDLRANRFVWRLLQGLGWAFNRLGGARLRFQLLP